MMFESRPLVHARILLTVVVACALLGSACKKKDANDDVVDGEGKKDAPIELINVRIKETPLELRIPNGWTAEDVDVAPLGEKPVAKDGEVPKVSLTGRLMFSLRAPDDDTGAPPPRIQLFHDPYLPVGTTASDYLRAQREANEAAIKGATKETTTDIRHVEAERSRRGGRPTYFVRDDWDLALGKKRETVSQVSLLLVDAPDDDTIHGYALVATMRAADRERLDKALRDIMASVKFAKD